MPLLSPILASIGISVGVIAYGIIVEKHYVSKVSLLPNLFAILFALSTLNNVSQIAIVVLMVYAFICMIGAWQGSNDFMSFLGSKVTGGILFGLSISEAQMFGINPIDPIHVLIAILVPSAIAVAIGYLISE